jgi:hypothetical protein
MFFELAMVRFAKWKGNDAMSQFLRVQTTMVEKRFLREALEEMGYEVEEGDKDIGGYRGRTIQAEMRIRTKSNRFDIGFLKNGEVYECVADWWGIRDLQEKTFLQKVTQLYAYKAAKTKLIEQGFTIVSEEKLEDERIHLVLRRAV